MNVFFENISCIPSWRNKTQDLHVLIGYLVSNKKKKVRNLKKNPLYYMSQDVKSYDKN